MTGGSWNEVDAASVTLDCCCIFRSVFALSEFLGGLRESVKAVNDDVGRLRAPNRWGGQIIQRNLASTNAKGIGPKLLLSKLWKGSSPSTHICPSGMRTSVCG